MIEIFSSFIASARVGQYIFMLLMVGHLVMAFERREEKRLRGQGIPIESPLEGLAFANWLYASIFLVYVASLGEVYPKTVTIPLTRCLWLVILGQMAYLDYIKARRILRVWLKRQ
jgi:hypothetical protein